MRPSTRLLQFGLLALVSACDLDIAPTECDTCEERRWTPRGFPSISQIPRLRPQHVRLDVRAGHIFAGDFRGNELTYWIIDPAVGIIDTQTIVVNPGALRRRGSVVVRAHDAAGVYVTTPDHNSRPAYSVAFRGDLQPGGVFSYLDTEAFDNLRLLAPQDMVDTHNTMIAGAQQLVTNFQADLDDFKDRVTEETFHAYIEAETHLSAGARLLTDANDMQGASTASMAPWAAALQGLEGDIDANAQTDVAIAEGTGLSLASLTPDALQIQNDVENCINAVELANDIEATVTQLFPDAVAEDDWEHDGRRQGASGPITDGDWLRNEDLLTHYLDGIKELGFAYEACVMQAVGGEQVITYDDILPDPYEAIGSQAEAEALQAEDAAFTFESDVRAAYADAIHNPEVAYNPAIWGAAEDNAMQILEQLVGPDMLADPAPITTGPVAVTRGASVSSANACQNTTPVFQISLGGLGLAIGTPFDDVIRGADEDGFEVLIGGKGDDCINGLSGHELIFGNAGDDELHGGDQHEIIFGNAGVDTIYTGNGEDYNITIPTTPPTTIILDVGSLAFGGPDEDFVSGADPDYDDTDNTFFGYTDVLFGDGITGTQANDEIEGGAGIDFLFGQAGNDDIFNHRPGRIRYTTPATTNVPAVTADIEFGSFHFGGRGVDLSEGSTASDLIFGNDDPDTLMGSDGLDLIFGGQGDDPLINGEAGVDLVFGGAGNDTVRGGEGIDLVMGNDGRDNVFGDPGVFDLLFGNADNDRVFGGDGFDLAFGGPLQDHVHGDAGFDILFGGADNDTILGGDGPDLAFGSQGRDLMEGGNSIDLMFGGAETDLIRGNDGIDIIFGNDGSDWLDGEQGIDLIWANGDSDAVYGGTEMDVLFGGGSEDCIWGEAGIDLAFGGDAGDFITGGPDLDLIVGGEGMDILRGDGGVDFMLGGADADHLTGGTELDLMWGGDADDTLVGNDGLDLFFAGSGRDCMQGDAGFDVAFGGSEDDLILGTSVAFGGDGEDEMAVGLAGFGGDQADTLLATGTGVMLMFGNEGDDDLYVGASAGLTLMFGNRGNDVMSAPGATPTSSSSPVRTFMFGNDGSDWMQASRGKARAFGNRGDDIMSGDPDGTSSNDDERDWHFGNRDSDALFGDASSRRDLLQRGAGSDPSRVRDGWPSTSPSWSSAHAAPSFGTCAPAPIAQFCDVLKQEPQEVGAPE